MEDKLNEAITLIAKTVDGIDLTAEESEKVFTDVALYDTEGYHYLAFCAALHAKGETSDELLGLCQSTEKLSVKLTPNIPTGKTIDLSGTGGGKIKTINVSTLASFVVSAAGYTVAKQAMFGITSPTGSADIFDAFGINIFVLQPSKVSKVLENVGICPLFTPAMSPKLANRSNLAKKVFDEKKIRIRSPFSLASFIYSPVPLKRRVYGCYSEKNLEMLAELFSKLGYQKSLVVHGVGGLPEVSNFGETIIAEQIGKKIKLKHLTPADFGLKKAKVEEITSGGKEQNIIDFLRILYSKEKGPKKDLVLANSSVALFVLGEVKDFPKGVDLGNRIIEEGLAFKKLEQLVKTIGNQEKLKVWKNKARI
jgi:anthranilate phosphoribosyltransferase